MRTPFNLILWVIGITKSMNYHHLGEEKVLEKKKKCRPPSLTLRLHVCKEYVLSRHVEQCRRPFSQKYGKAVELGGIIETLSHET